MADAVSKARADLRHAKEKEGPQFAFAFWQRTIEAGRDQHQDGEQAREQRTDKARQPRQ